MLWKRRKKMTPKTNANSKWPIPNEGGFRVGCLFSMTTETAKSK